MIESGWRTVTVRSGNRIFTRNGMLTVSEENSVLSEIPIKQVRTCIFDSTRLTVTVPLLLELTESGVAVIFCNEKHTPSCELLGCSAHKKTSGRIFDQTKWTQENKDVIWNRIIRNKIKMQLSLLRLKNKHIPNALDDCDREFLTEDAESCEALAARLYFRSLFGFAFLRHSSDNDNAMLDYGYAIIRNTVNQAVVSCGYHPAIGIHHHNRENSVNLSCDIMEPFRPFVDRIVYERNATCMGKNERNALLSVLDAQCRYHGTVSTLQYAIHRYTEDVTAALTDNRTEIWEVEFV